MKIKILDTANLATKTTLNPKINEVKGEIASITNLATTAALNAKINEGKGKIPNITKLVSINAFTGVEIKIPNVINLVKKIDYNTKINEIKKKKKTKKFKRNTSNKTKHLLVENEFKKTANI